MARLPVVGEENWGGILNEYLLVSHEEDGTLREAVVAETVPDATTTSKGVVQLAGDLAGAAEAPLVPALAAKQSKYEVNYIENHPVFRRINDKYSQSLAAANHGVNSQANLTIHVVGDSIAEGFGVSKYGKRMTALLRYMLAGKRGNYSYYQPSSASTFSTVNAADWPGAQNPWITSNCSGTLYGFGMHGMRIAPGGHAELNFIGSYVNIYYTKTASSSATIPTVVTIDGSQVTTINAHHSSTSSGFIQPAFVGGDANGAGFGAHTLRIACPSGGGEFQLEGVMVGDGSSLGSGLPAQGTITLLESTHAGFATTHFVDPVSTWDAAWGSGVDVAIILLGANDQALATANTPTDFKNRLLTLLQRLDTKAGHTKTMYILTLFDANGMTQQWRDALMAAAKEFDANRAVGVPMYYFTHDWQGLLTGNQANDTDPAHGNDIGHMVVARTLYRLMIKNVETVPPTPPRSTVTSLDVPKYRNNWTQSLSINGDTSPNNTTPGYLTYRIWLDPGTYEGVARFRHHNAGGNASVQLHHTVMGTVNTYATSANIAQTTLPTQVVIDAPQWSYVTIRKLGTKQSASSNYGVTFNEVHIRKVA